MFKLCDGPSNQVWKTSWGLPGKPNMLPENLTFHQKYLRISRVIGMSVKLSKHLGNSTIDRRNVQNGAFLFLNQTQWSKLYSNHLFGTFWIKDNIAGFYQFNPLHVPHMPYLDHDINFYQEFFHRTTWVLNSFANIVGKNAFASLTRVNLMLHFS